MLSSPLLGDDIVILERRSETPWLMGTIASSLIVKDSGGLGPRDSQLTRSGIMHRTSKWFGPEESNGKSVADTCKGESDAGHVE